MKYIKMRLKIRKLPTIFQLSDMKRVTKKPGIKKIINR
jgi:hypothetical protein